MFLSEQTVTHLRHSFLRIHGFLWLLVLLVATTASSSFATDSLATERHPLVLVLSGGGARGMAHIGAIRALERHGIYPDLIVGSSIGGVIGALWASGYSADEMKHTFSEFDWISLFSDRPVRTAMFLSKREYDQQGLLTLRFGPGGRPVVPTGITNGQALFNTLRRLFERAPFQPNPSYDALRFPVRIVCSDLISGGQRVFSEVDLALACRATIGYPLFFTPVPYEGHLYADGGIAENVPTMVARELSPNAVVLTIDCSAATASDQLPTTPWEIADRVTAILQAEHNDRSLSRSDVVVRPKVEQFSATDFTVMDSLIVLGESAAEEVITKNSARLSPAKIDTAKAIYTVLPPPTKNTPRLKEFISPDRWSPYYQLEQQYRERDWVSGYISKIEQISDRTFYTVQPPIVRDIRVVGTSRSFETLMKGESGIKRGEPLRMSDMDRTVEYLYSSGMFEFVFPVREAVPNGIALTFIVQERKLPVLRLGAGYDLHRGGSGQVQFLYDNIFGVATHGAATFQFGERDLNAVLRFHADQIIDRFGSIDFEVSGTRTEWPRFSTSQLPAVSYRRAGTSVSIGQSVGRWSSIAAGIRAQTLTVDQTGSRNIYRLSPLFLQWNIDTEDRSPFPTRGTRLLSAWESAQGKWSDAIYNRLYIYESTTLRLSRRLVVSPSVIGGFNSDDTPRSEWYRIGGPWDFWGLSTGERESRNLGMGAMTIRYDLVSRLVADTYVELRANIAVLTENRQLKWKEGERVMGGGVGIALSTWLGPMRFVYGWAGNEVAKATPTISLSLGSSIPNPLGPRTYMK